MAGAGWCDLLWLLVGGEFDADHGSFGRKAEAEEGLVAVEQAGGLPLAVDEGAFFGAEELGVLLLAAGRGAEFDAGVEADDEELIGCDLRDEGAAGLVRCLGAEDATVLGVRVAELDENVELGGADEAVEGSAPRRRSGVCRCLAWMR
jgi:hypothetical protein